MNKPLYIPTLLHTKEAPFIGLDLDETLVHCVKYTGLSNRPDDAELYITVENNEHYAVYKRKGLDDFIAFVNTHFNVFIYTRATKEYASQIINKLFPGIIFFDRDFTERKEFVIADAYTREAKRVVFKKDLAKIATLLNTTIDKIIFIDDVVNEDEITPREALLAIPEFLNEGDDNDLLIIKDHIKKGLETQQPGTLIGYIRSLDLMF